MLTLQGCDVGVGGSTTRGERFSAPTIIAATSLCFSLIFWPTGVRADCADDGSGTLVCNGTTDSRTIGLVVGPNVLLNQGTIQVPVPPLNGVIVGGDSAAIQNNAGATITSNGQTAIATTTDQDLRINNDGLISLHNVNGAAAIRFGLTDATPSNSPILNNTGRIESATTAIKTSARVYDFTLNNTGTIVGSTNGAIQLFGLNHTLNFANGSVVEGIIVRMTPGVGLAGHGNDIGSDIVNLTGSGRFIGGFSGPFDRLTMNGGTWTLSQQVSSSAQFDTVAIDAGTFNLLSGTLAVGTLATVASGATLYIDQLAALSGNAQISGTLIANGLSPGANVTVMGPSGVVSGTGTLGALDVLAGGTVAPGSTSVGTLTSASYAAAQGSTLRISLDGTQTSLLNVTGAASLGGSLQVQLAPSGAAPVEGTVYTVVQAGSLTGRFAAVNQSFAFFTLADSYTATQAQIVATRLPFNNPTATNNVRNLVTGAQAIDTHAATPAPARNGDLSDISDQLVGLSPAAARAALHSVSGESYAAFTTVALEQMDVFRSTALDAAGACEARGGLVQGHVCSWLDVSRLNGYLRGTGDLAGFNYSLTGVQGGTETRLPMGTILGVTLGFGHQRLSDFEYASRQLKGDAGFIGAHAAHQWGQLQLVGLAGFSLFDNEATRNITVGNVNRRAQSSYGGQGVTAAGALRWWSEWGAMRVAPEFILAHSQYRQDGFTETGAGSLNLRVQSSDAQSLVTGTGVRADGRLQLGDVILRPSAVLRYEHSWIGGARTDHKTTASFAEVPASGSWTVYGQNRGNDAAIIRLGLSADITSDIAFFAGVTGEWRSTGTEWGGGFGLRAVF